MNCLVLLNHRLTAEQEEDLVDMGYEPIYPKSEVQALWGQVPTTPDGPEVVAKDILDYVSTMSWRDRLGAAIVQGEMGTTFKVVEALKKEGLHCFHAVSRREVVEEALPDGSVTKKAVFRHIMWRKY